MYDKIYCINLDKRTDRWTEFQRDVLEGLELDKGKFERISAIDTCMLDFEYSGAIGCSLSHLKIWKDMIDNGYDSVLIFEDDFKPLKSAKEFKYIMSELYKNHPNFTVCCLGWHSKDYSVFFNRDDIFSFANGIASTSSYIISQKQAKLMYNAVVSGILEMFHKGTPAVEFNSIDFIWKDFQSHQWLLVRDRVGVQRNGYSDIAAYGGQYDE